MSSIMEGGYGHVAESLIAHSFPFSHEGELWTTGGSLPKVGLLILQRTISGSLTKS